ncbi:MAG: YCF48-related protein [Pseudomonadota bacterium]
MPRLLTVLVAMALIMPVPGWSGGVPDSLERSSAVCRNAERSVLLDVARAGNRLIAVGERGIIIWSDDTGKSWRQAEVPASESLTAVDFPTATKGWAVGHGGIVLHTEDSGKTWSRQLDGAAAAKLALDAAEAAAQAAGPKDRGAQRRLAEAQRLVDDGPDKPFLDVQFEDERRGFIVGAYSLMFRTEDAGQTWTPWMDRLNNPKGLHLYAIRIIGEAVYLAGEQGLFLRSLDGGNTFERRDTPYPGAYFTLTADAAGAVVLAGLRGNAFRSADRGDSFSPVSVPIPASLNAVTRAEDGTLYFANQAGFVLVSRDQGRTLRPLPARRLPPVAALISLGPKALLTVGWGGAIPVSLEAAGAAGGSP